MVNPHGKLYSCLTTFDEIRSAVREEVNAKPQVTLITALADSISGYGKWTIVLQVLAEMLQGPA